MTDKKPDWLSNPQIIEALQTQALRLKGGNSALRLWERVFTEKERKLLGGNLEKAWKKLGTAGMWIKLYHVSPERAVIDAALKIGCLDQSTYDWLSREFGDQKPKERPLDRPTWRAEAGELIWRGHVVRRLRRFEKPSNIFQILTSFQRKKWAHRIANPLKMGQEQLHQSIRSLNHDLKALRFHAEDGAKYISWKVA